MNKGFIDTLEKMGQFGTLNLFAHAAVKVSELAASAGGLELQSEKGIRFMAARARQLGAGNCQEHAAVAYTYLRGRQTGPVEFMGIFDAESGAAQHAFVVLGREEKESPL